MEMPEVQAARVLYQRNRGDSLITLQDRRRRITVERVLRARGKMMKNKANGPADCLETEMLQRLPMETVYEVTHWFENVSRECAGLQRRGKFFATTTLPVLDCL